jgi:hypothetical protein
MDEGDGWADRKTIVQRTIQVLLGVAFGILLIWIWTLPAHSQAPILSGHWISPTVYQIDVAQSGCLRAMPSDAGLGACDFSGQPWVATVSRSGNSDTAATPGRWYVLEQGGVFVGRVDVRYLAWFPFGAKE